MWPRSARRGASAARASAAPHSRAGAAAASAPRGERRHLSGGGGLFPYDLGTSYLVKPGLAHVRGPAAPALIELTVDGMFRRSVQQHPQRSAAVVCDGADCVDAEHTYESLDAKVDDLARGLGRLGIRAGDRVGVWMPNNEEWLLMQLATSRIGALLTCINPAYRVRELVHALNLAQVRALVLVPSVASSNYVEMLDELVGVQLAGRTAATCRAPLKCPELPHLEHLVLAESSAAVRAGKLSEESAARFVLFSTLLEKHGSVPGDGGLTPEHGINIQFTSGTTGRPKATLLSSRTIVNNGFLVARGQGLGPDARINCSVPLYHCFGLVMSNLAAFTIGGSVVYPSRVFSARKTLDVAARFKCTTQQGVPTMFAAMLDEFRAHPRELSLRAGIMAGAACPPVLMRQVAEHLGLKDLVICYGTFL
jgi:fatty-acyl-CoA synthase